MSSSLLSSYVIQEQQQMTQVQSVTSTSPELWNQSKLKKCNCCPYGFHIDLDFIRYCEELAANGKCVSSKQLDRRNKRRQRKSLEVMLGFEDQWIHEFEKKLPLCKSQSLTSR